MTTLEYAWRVTQQLVTFAPTDNKYEKISGWGSGFFYLYKDNMFLVTADHVIHYDDYRYGEGRICADEKLAVFNNQNSKNEIGTMLTPIGGLFYFERYDLAPIMKENVTQDDVDLASIPEIVDAAFSIITELKEYILTHELSFAGEILVKEGISKLCINSLSVCTPSENDRFIVVGTVKNKITNSIKIDRVNAIYEDMSFVQYKADGNISLFYPSLIHYEDWAGLSGGPVLSMEGKLLGIILQVDDGGHEVTVKPMAEVHKLMDNALKFEKTTKL